MRTVMAVLPAVVIMMTKMTIMGLREGKAEEIMVLQVVVHAGDLAL